MKMVMLLLAMLVGTVALTVASDARVNSTKMFCWVPDAEFPIACDEDDDD
jgi:hypothetical protein